MLFGIDLLQNIHQEAMAKTKALQCCIDVACVPKIAQSAWLHVMIHKHLLIWLEELCDFPMS